MTKVREGEIVRLKSLSFDQQKFAGNNGSLARVSRATQHGCYLELLAPGKGHRTGAHSFSDRYYEKL